MTITTSQNKTYEVLWIDSPITDDSHLLLAMRDGRAIMEIAPEFTGLTIIQRFDENQGDKAFEGYPVLRGITQTSSGVVQITLGRV